ncbi:MarR family winged helix-turn-helix transcriptional regulator [bacterium 210820-DFI.6.37]|nr:MarR family winged helix-turn-helix transcriptional regulator [bacterium 210820-DFI.6.37]
MYKSIARMITLLARKSQGYIGTALNKYNITAAEQPFFMALQVSEGITQEELTAIVCVDKAATARAVKSLEEKGFLLRRQDTRDRRQNRIYPTALTRELGPAVREELHRFNDMLTRGLDPKQVELIYDGLLKMEENFAVFSLEEDRKKEKGETENE